MTRKANTFSVRVVVEVKDPNTLTEIDAEGNGINFCALNMEEVVYHVAEAVARWGGQLHPDDGLHSRNILRVTVRDYNGEFAAEYGCAPAVGEDA